MRRALTATATLGTTALLLLGTGCSHGVAKVSERHLVYVRGNGISASSVWIADVNGAHSRRLTRGSLGVITPDGRTVAISRGREGIYVVSSDGKGLRRLTARKLRPQAWSQDGKTLVATVETEHAVPELVGIDGDSGRVRTIARGSIYGFDFEPGGDELVYSRAPEATFEGICGDQFDLFVVKVDGGTPRRITHDGLSAFPAWGPSRIAYARFQASTSISECSAPGVWTVDPDGSSPRPVVARAPDSIVLRGFYGFQPLAWLDDERVLVGLRSDSGTEGAVVDTRTHRVRRLNDYADEASTDGRFSVGSGGDQTLALSILRIRDARRVFHRDGCCPDWNR
jgi:Tol biopolymer transport system component